MMGHGSIYTLSIVSIFHLKDGQNFANFFKSFLAAEFMRHTLIPIIKTGREWTFLIPISNHTTEVQYCMLFPMNIAKIHGFAIENLIFNTTISFLVKS